MAQGTVKKLGRATPAKITHSKRQASKVHKPKKTKASVDKVHKKFTSGMTARTEALLEGIQDTEELVDDDDPEDEVTDGVTKYLVTQLLAITQDPPKDITPYLMPDVSLPVVEADQQLFKSTVTSMLERAQRYAMK
ncbi:hypothetical protein HZS61_003795 [Fusarium oxysporum f. sp. conglutinans]|uniref:Uncharacterized protein n=1 Tax=Fusarium oxysporum f. sp. conglutinans TaxID=100902 RepID=A0A8H6GF40_FUSOX|nr:hypothetical protein HZS61_003795 [Fusarium oxysporum f. sp. conglutinans]